MLGVGGEVEWGGLVQFLETLVDGDLHGAELLVGDLEFHEFHLEEEAASLLKHFSRSSDV